MAVGLMWGMVGGDQDDLLKAYFFSDGLSADEVAVVNGVETATKTEPTHRIPQGNSGKLPRRRNGTELDVIRPTATDPDGCAGARLAKNLRLRA